MDEPNGSWPDPSQARDLDEFIELLARLRVWAGNPSYRLLAKKAGPLLRPPRVLSHATLANAFQPGRRRLDFDVVVAAVRAMGLDPVEVERWRQACIRVHAGPKTPKTGGPAGVFRQLPADLVTFTGREAALKELLDTVSTPGSDRPTTVVMSAIEGMGGIGKSALAVRAAHLLSGRFPDGQLFLDLHGYTQGMAPRDPDDALACLLTSLGLPPGKIPAERDARAAVYRERLAGTRTLILLDNAATEAQVRPLIPGSGGCVVLITSRKSLKGLDGAHTVALDVLSEPDAVALLRVLVGPERAPAEDPGWQRIAELCGCLPLAVRIAAALIRHRPAWTLSHLADKLRAASVDLNSFTDGERDVSAVFDLSYRTLADDQRDLLRRLGLAPGPDIDAYAAAALSGTDPGTAERLLQGLVDHHLLSEPVPSRYRVHDLIRAYAHAQAVALDAEPERDRALDRLMHYYAHTAQTVSPAVTRFPRPEPDGPAPAHVPDLSDPDTARAWLRTEQPNLDASLGYAHTHRLEHHVVALAAGLAGLLHADGPWARAMDLHRTAAQAAERLGLPAAHAAALTDLGRVRYQAGDYAEACEPLARAVEIDREIGDRTGEAHALTDLGRVRLQIGDYPGADNAHARALEIYREIGDRSGQAHALAALGRAKYQAGDYPGAVDAHTEALLAYREIGNRNGEAYVLTALGRVRFMLGDFSGASAANAQALRIYRETGHRNGEAHTLADMGRVWLQLGDFPKADEALTRALEIQRELGSRNGEAFALTDLGRVRFHTGAHAEAGEIHARALKLYRDIGHRNGEAVALTELGRVWLHSGELLRARDTHAQALKVFRETGARGNESWALNYYAAAVAAIGDGPGALALYRQALAMNQELDKPDDEAISLEGIAQHHLSTGETAEGAAHLRQALAIYRRLGMDADMRRVQSRLADIADIADPAEHGLAAELLRTARAASTDLGNPLGNPLGDPAA